jgi:DNA helicase II / ATP-dependent DNA helicase PcrA
LTKNLPDTSPPAIVLEEEELLQQNRRRLLENPEVSGPSEGRIISQLLQLRDDVNTAKTEDLPSLYQQMNHLNSLLDQIRGARKERFVDPDCPYFAHLRLDESGKERDVFLGRATRLSHGLRIVDWRNAPISRLFYRYKEGEDYLEEIAESLREGFVSARRILHIQHGELLRVADSVATYVKRQEGWNQVDREQVQLAGGEGAALRAGSPLSAHLGAGAKHRATKFLPDIAALIDPEQFDLITAKTSGVLVIRGSAGSGKTTVALHRIAYLCYESPRRFRSDKLMFIVRGRAMRDYVAHVLPSLGVQGVRVSTWSKWARRMVRAHFPMLPKVVDGGIPSAVRLIKLHHTTEERLRAHIQSTRKPATATQAIDDWMHVLTDFNAIRTDLGEELDENQLNQAFRWLGEQQESIAALLDREPEAHAQLDPEDDAILLRAFQLRVRPLSNRQRRIEFSHLAIDEVQDFSPIEILVLLGICDKHQSVTLAGDTRQHISQESGFSSWSGFLKQINVESTALNTLEISYRSTHSIIRFAQALLEDDSQQAPRTVREGPSVEFFAFSDHGACVAFLAEGLRDLLLAEPLANIALLAPSSELAKTYFNGLQDADLEQVRLVQEQKFAFAPGIDVVEVRDVKGLEFDYVIVVEVSAFHYPDSPHHRRLLHVAATRAVHQLWLTSCATPSSILPATMS